LLSKSRDNAQQTFVRFCWGDAKKEKKEEAGKESVPPRWDFINESVHPVSIAAH